MTGMEYMEAIVAGKLPPPPIAVTMRMGPIELGEGRAVFAGEPGEEHYNPIGVVHGGYAATLLDSALGCAVHTTLPAGVGYTSLGLEAKYVRPITRDTGRVLCEANVLYRGRRQATAEASLTSAESGKLLAHGSRHLHAARRRVKSQSPSSRASSTRRRTPKPLASLPVYSRPTSQAVPAMSTCAQGVSPTNSSRKEPA